MTFNTWRIALLVGTALWLSLGCRPANEQVETPAMPAWLDEMPAADADRPPFEVGQKVWAVVPAAGRGGAHLGTYRVATVGEDGLELDDELGRRFDDVQTALVHPVVESQLTVGAWLLISRGAAPAAVGVVWSSPEAQQPSIAVGWNGLTRSWPGDAEGATWSAADGSALPAVVAFRRDAEGPWFRGIAFAASDQQVWLVDDGGYVHQLATDQQRPLADLRPTVTEVGTEVLAYRWADGYRPGTITALDDDGLRLTVDHGDDAEVGYFVTDLLASAALR